MSFCRSVPSLLFCLFAGLTAPTSTAQAQHGDVTSEMVTLGNPLAVAGIPNRDREVHCIRYYDNKLYLGFGHSQSAQVNQFPWLDLVTNTSGSDTVSGGAGLEEITRLRIFDGTLYAHSYDVQSGGQRYFTKTGSAGWVRVNVNGGVEHSRDMVLFDGSIYWQNTDTNAAVPYPSIRSAPANDPSGNFTKVNQSLPSGFADANSFAGREFFEFDGKLYLGHEQINEFVFGFPGNYGKIPYILRYDPANASAGWQVSHGRPNDLIAEADLPSGNRFAWHPTSPVELVTPVGRRLLFSSTHRNAADTTSTANNRLYVSSSLAPGNLATYVPLPGIPENINMSHVGIIYREGRLFVASFLDPRSSVNKVWLHEAVDLCALENPASWSELFHFTKPYIGGPNSFNLYQNGTFEFVNGRFYFSETGVTVAGGPLNQVNGGRIWGIALDAVSRPLISPEAASGDLALHVTLSTATPESSIYYTTDGSVPSGTNGTLYTGPIPVRHSLTLQAIGFKTGLSPSFLSSATYSIDLAKSWRAVHGLDLRGGDDLENPSDDGIPNRLKYAFNMAPTAGSLSLPNLMALTENGTSGLPLVARDSNTGLLTITCIRMKESLNPGISYVPQFGSNLVNWHPATGIQTVTEIDSLWQRVTVQDDNTQADTRFGRMMIVGPDIATLMPAADSFVFDRNPTVNNGTAAALTVKGGSTNNNRSAYLRFDLSGYTAPVAEAILRLTVTLVGNEGPPPRTVQVRRLSDDSWTEPGITWNNSPASGAVISSFNGDPVGSVVEVDITAYVNEEITGDKTLSLVLQQATTVNRLVSMSSREGTSPPELQITK